MAREKRARRQWKSENGLDCAGLDWNELRASEERAKERVKESRVESVCARVSRLTLSFSRLAAFASYSHSYRYSSAFVAYSYSYEDTSHTSRELIVIVRVNNKSNSYRLTGLQEYRTTLLHFAACVRALNLPFHSTFHSIPQQSRALLQLLLRPVLIVRLLLIFFSPSLIRNLNQSASPPLITGNCFLNVGSTLQQWASGSNFKSVRVPCRKSQRTRETPDAHTTHEKVQIEFR